ncbi:MULTISPECIES: hypothetical protein [unclassified Variovorax]|uniref:hypothetical protein n=1 Tax=unclassified Variovorax TaxID=663243 RepID=UPI00076D8EC8|nr:MULTISPECIES: hypothetical protein [unclassified Variovorax]KWT95584.1 hypothetical protein APY03_2461 [Variovorax sp. WDL1]PNG50196.1 hypothetical protein CHC06_05819 [Variovorax sp. B2]PNG51069.1 hypothetical protein CHC07_05725 [Variovorax sp. B4]VTU42296.1 hypothetical protein SRS16P1_00234 [Variovorax sp. SRS16]VTU42321.1 hypothetical protein E5P1_00232 [Variovorax sp. PBL-E5]
MTSPTHILDDATADAGEASSNSRAAAAPGLEALRAYAFAGFFLPEIKAEHERLNEQAAAVIARRTVLRDRVWELLKARVALHRELFPTLWAQDFPVTEHLAYEYYECPPDDWSNDALDHWSVRAGRFEATIADKDVDAKFKLLSIPEVYMGPDGERAMRDDAALVNAHLDA